MNVTKPNIDLLAQKNGTYAPPSSFYSKVEQLLRLALLKLLSNSTDSTSLHRQLSKSRTTPEAQSEQPKLNARSNFSDTEEFGDTPEGTTIEGIPSNYSYELSSAANAPLTRKSSTSGHLESFLRNLTSPTSSSRSTIDVTTPIITTAGKLDMNFGEVLESRPLSSVGPINSTGSPSTESATTSIYQPNTTIVIIKKHLRMSTPSSTSSRTPLRNSPIPPTGTATTTPAKKSTADIENDTTTFMDSYQSETFTSSVILQTTENGSSFNGSILSNTTPLEVNTGSPPPSGTIVSGTTSSEEQLGDTSSSSTAPIGSSGTLQMEDFVTTTVLPSSATAVVDSKLSGGSSQSSASPEILTESSEIDGELVTPSERNVADNNKVLQRQVAFTDLPGGSQVESLLHVTDLRATTSSTTSEEHFESTSPASSTTISTSIFLESHLVEGAVTTDVTSTGNADVDNELQFNKTSESPTDNMDSFPKLESLVDTTAFPRPSSAVGVKKPSGKTGEDLVVLISSTDSSPFTTITKCDADSEKLSDALNANAARGCTVTKASSSTSMPTSRTNTEMRKVETVSPTAIEEHNRKLGKTELHQVVNLKTLLEKNDVVENIAATTAGLSRKALTTERNQTSSSPEFLSGRELIGGSLRKAGKESGTSPDFVPSITSKRSSRPPASSTRKKVSTKSEFFKLPKVAAHSKASHASKNEIGELTTKPSETVAMTSMVSPSKSKMDKTSQKLKRAGLSSRVPSHPPFGLRNTVSEVKVSTMLEVRTGNSVANPSLVGIRPIDASNGTNEKAIKHKKAGFNGKIAKGKPVKNRKIVQKHKDQFNPRLILRRNSLMIPMKVFNRVSKTFNHKALEGPQKSSRTDRSDLTTLFSNESKKAKQGKQFSGKTVAVHNQRNNFTLKSFPEKNSATDFHKEIAKLLFSMTNDNNH
ncbi:unnamed protein product, partial [Haemonchus placei]|uniref:Flocculation protein FLO11 n=1 Tax=Haemonchus placei TaxID=6290 RepID=A0A0N4VVC2_HAEPC